MSFTVPDSNSQRSGARHTTGVRRISVAVRTATVHHSSFTLLAPTGTLAGRTVIAEGAPLMNKPVSHNGVDDELRRFFAIRRNAVDSKTI